MKITNILTVFCILLNFSVCPALATSLEVINEKLLFNNIAVPTAISFENYQKNSERKVLFSSTDHNEYSIVKIISLNGSTEFWLYIKSKESFLHLNTYPVNLSVRWVNDEVVVFERKSMGTSISILNLIETDKRIKTSGYIKDFVAFDQNSQLIFSWSNINHQLTVYDFTFSKSFPLPGSASLTGMVEKKDSLISVRFLECEVLVEDRTSHEPSVKISLNKENCEKVHQFSQ